MAASIINVFNKLTGNSIESKETYESLLDEFYDKFVAVYHVIKDLPKTHIENIDCAKFEGTDLCVYISIDNPKELEKVHKKISKKLSHDIFDFITYTTPGGHVIIVIKDKVME